MRRNYHPALLKPAMSRYGPTSPALLRWMKPLNEGKSYAQLVKPFGFLVAFMARGMTLDELAQIIPDEPKRVRPPDVRRSKPIAPFERDPKIAASRAFDRETGEPDEASALRCYPTLDHPGAEFSTPFEALKSYAAALQFYHVSAEDKFENSGPADFGPTARRHSHVEAIRLGGSTITAAPVSAGV